MRFLVVLLLTFLPPALAFAGPLEDAKAAFVTHNYDAGLKLLQPLAEQGNAEAQYNLGFMYHQGWGVKRDYNQAAAWYEKAAMQGNEKAENNLGLFYLKGLGVKQNDAEAFKWYQKATDQGDLVSQTMLATMYAAGRGTPADVDKATKLFQQAAEQGFAPAQFYLGYGDKNLKNYKDAYFWLTLAASSGAKNATEVRDDVSSHLTPQEISEIDKTIADWKPTSGAKTPHQLTLNDIQHGYQDLGAEERLASQGLLSAQYNLGKMLYDADQAPRNFLKSFFWFSIAANGGSDAAATYRDMAAMFLTPQQVVDEQKLIQDWKPEPVGDISKDSTLANNASIPKKVVIHSVGNAKTLTADNVKNLTQTGKKGNRDAQYILGIVFHNGWGAAQSDKEAAKWYLKAAEQGLDDAQFTIGSMYRDGVGVSQDYKEAYFWLILAVNSSYKFEAMTRIPARDYVASLLTDQQKLDIETRAKNWKPTPASVTATKH